MPIAKVHAFDNRSVKLAAFAKALSHPARIRILGFLVRAGESACMDIVAELPLSQPACSRHINELKRAGLLKSREAGKQIFFRVDGMALKAFCRSMNGTLHPDGG